MLKRWLRLCMTFSAAAVRRIPTIAVIAAGEQPCQRRVGAGPFLTYSSLEAV